MHHLIDRRLRLAGADVPELGPVFGESVWNVTDHQYLGQDRVKLRSDPGATVEWRPHSATSTIFTVGSAAFPVVTSQTDRNAGTFWLSAGLGTVITARCLPSGLRSDP